MDMELSKYKATIGCFIRMSRKKLKEVRDWFTNRPGGSPNILICIYLFVFLFFVNVSTMRMLLVMKGVEENPWPRNISRVL